MRILLLVSILSAGCAPTVMVNGHEIIKDPWDDAHREILTRASFEMRCPESDIQLKILHEHSGWAKTVGAEGCGQRLTYKFVFSVGWVADTFSSEQDAAAAKPDDSAPPTNP